MKENLKGGAKMQKLSLTELKELFRWASKRKDSKGRSLLQRARESIITGSYHKYNTQIEIKDGKLYWDCDCPDARKRKHSRACCKHAIAHIILTHEKELRKHSKKWNAWFSELENKQIEEALETFSAFASL